MRQCGSILTFALLSRECVGSPIARSETSAAEQLVNVGHLTVPHTPIEDGVATSHHMRRIPAKLRVPMLATLSMSQRPSNVVNHSAKQPAEKVVVWNDGHLEAASERAPDGEDDISALQAIFGGKDGHINPLAQVPPAANVFDVRILQSHPVTFGLHGSEPIGVSDSLAKGVRIAVVIMLLVCFLLACACIDEASPQSHHPKSPATPHLTFDPERLMDGPWGRVYQEAEGETKEALELLFRCNIISTDEFAVSEVSQERILECTWIAAHMLRHKPLQEWVALWGHAQGSLAQRLNSHPAASASASSDGALHFDAENPHT